MGTSCLLLHASRADSIGLRPEAPQVRPDRLIMPGREIGAEHAKPRRACNEYSQKRR